MIQDAKVNGSKVRYYLHNIVLGILDKTGGISWIVYQQDRWRTSFSSCREDLKMKKERTLLDIYILEILEKYASKDKPMMQTTLIKKLADYPYEIEVARNTLSAYLKKLRDDDRIRGKRGVYKPGLFDDHELRLLIDGVLFGQHIPKEIATELINKLKGMSELGLKNRVRYVQYLPSMPRTENKNLYEIIDKIDEAI